MPLVNAAQGFSPLKNGIFRFSLTFCIEVENYLESGVAVGSTVAD